MSKPHPAIPLNCYIILSAKITTSKFHWLTNYKDIKTKCRLCSCLIVFIAWRFSQSCWFFRPSFVNDCPLVSLSFTLLLPKFKVLCTDSVWLGGGGGVLIGVGDHILQEFQHSLSDQIQNQCADPPVSPCRQVKIIWTIRSPSLLPTGIGEWYSQIISI